MAVRVRGADVVARTLEQAGLSTIFTLSGNHIMPVFDAAIDAKLKLIHVRHEAATVHMADGWARLTGQCGVALVTGGPGHANAVGALCTAQAAESPLVLLSGHAALNELGRGAFQELHQAEMAAPATKASWVAHSSATFGIEIAKAVCTAMSGRPGPVHLSVPFDLLQERVDNTANLWPSASAFGATPMPLGESVVNAVLAAISSAARPLILAGPMLCTAAERKRLTRLSLAARAPAVGMESPRGVNDPSLGAFPEVLRCADLVILLGKPHDFTLRFGDAPFVDPACRFVVIDADAALIERVAREKGPRLLLSAIADPRSAVEGLLSNAPQVSAPASAWMHEVADAIAFRPAAWASLRSSAGGKLHPVELCQAIVPHFENDPNAVLVCDGGEIGQWPQSLIRSSRRIINGVAGSIGAAIPFAIAARLAEPKAPIIAVMGDGTFGFHMAEFDTAIRYGLPFVAVVGNDAGWNAEHQIQLRNYGKERAHGCELLPTRYDRVVEALGGHGEFVTAVDDLGPAIERAIGSGKPACINVMMERVPAPLIKRFA